MPVAQLLIANKLRSLPGGNVTYTVIESSSNVVFKILAKYLKLCFSKCFDTLNAPRRGAKELWVHGSLKKKKNFWILT